MNRCVGLLMYEMCFCRQPNADLEANLTPQWDKNLPKFPPGMENLRHLFKLYDLKLKLKL